MTHTRRRLSLLAVAAALLPFTALAADPVRIGVLLPLSGGAALAGTEIIEGVRFAADEANARGGVLGRPIQLLVEDDEGSPTKGASAARKLVESEKVVAISGSYVSGVTLAETRITRANKIPMVSAGSTAVAVTDANTPGDLWFFRAFPGSDEQGDQSAEDIIKRLHGKRIAIIHDVSDYGASLARQMTAVAARDGVPIVANQSYNSNEQDFYSLLTQVQEAKPDTIYVAGLQDAGAMILRQAGELGIKAQFVGSGSMMTDKFIELTGPASEGFAVSSMYEPGTPNPVGHDFGQRFRAKFGKDADVYSALGFDSMNVIIEAIRRAGSTDGVAIRNALLTLGDFPLVEGPPGTTAKFDAKGSVSFKIGLAVVRNGKRAWLPFD